MRTRTSCCARRGRQLVTFMRARPRAGLRPRMRWPDGRWQPSRRRFPTGGGTIVRRTPLGSSSAPMRSATTTCSTSTSTNRRPDYLGAFLLMRRAMLDELGGWDGGFRHYGEDIDLAYRAAKAGWERWYVPAARGTRLRRGRRRPFPDPAHAVRARGALRPQASRAVEGALTASFVTDPCQDRDECETDTVARSSLRLSRSTTVLRPSKESPMPPVRSLVLACFVALAVVLVPAAGGSGTSDS